jgi:hypothetical protein
VHSAFFLAQVHVTRAFNPQSHLVEVVGEKEDGISWDVQYKNQVKGEGKEFREKIKK